MSDGYELIAKDGELVISETALALFDKASSLKHSINILQAELDKIEKPLKKAMKEGNVKSYKGDALSATYVADTMREEVNTEAMKRDGIYEKYMLLVPKSGYVRIKYREKKDD